MTGITRRYFITQRFVIYRNNIYKGRSIMTRSVTIHPAVDGGIKPKAENFAVGRLFKVPCSRFSAFKWAR